MQFNSIEYVAFFLAYLLLARLLSSRWDIGLVIASSLVFYAWWNPWLVWVPACLCTIAFVGALWQERATSPAARRRRLLAVIAGLLAPLTVFKYEHFLYNDIVAPIAGTASYDLRWTLPLGISFITFTMVAYIVDVYRGRFAAEKSYLHVLAYTLFFPQLIAGPILRPAELLPQLLRANRFRLASIGLGLTVFTIGLTKKTLFADQLGDIVDPIFAMPDGHNLPTYWIALLGFAVQIYCDFSGYTDMAIGSAIMLGVRLPANFDRPYAALSLREFWKTWHMTLSRWLRDYLYIPLGGSQRPVHRHMTNIMITMALGGLWHGANWTFLIWGAVHGIGIAFIHAMQRFPTGAALCAVTPAPLKWLMTFGFVVLAWSLFRAPDLATAATIVTGAFGAPLGPVIELARLNGFAIVLLALFALLHRYDSLATVRLLYRNTHRGVLAVAGIVLWALAIALTAGGTQRFIYFDF